MRHVPRLRADSTPRYLDGGELLRLARGYEDRLGIYGVTREEARAKRDVARLQGQVADFEGATLIRADYLGRHVEALREAGCEVRPGGYRRVTWAGTGYMVRR